tara:strand:- start:111 stop:1625 length:1515 start_codon:yes stop_codon:yes gene_type:complete
MKGKYKKVCIIALSIFFIFILLDIIDEQIFELMGSSKENILRSSRCCGFEPIPNKVQPPFIIDDRGFRVTPFDHRKKTNNEVYKIVMIGDSGIFGDSNGIFLDIPSYLEFLLHLPKFQSKLPKGMKLVDVINAGVHGYSSDQSLSQLKSKILKMNPNMIIISVGKNDRPIINNFFKIIIKKIFGGKFNIKNTKTEIEPSVVVYNKYEKNIRAMIDISIEAGAVPVLVPWSHVGSKKRRSNSTQEQTESYSDTLAINYKGFANILEKMSREYNIPFIYTPFQLPIIPLKIHFNEFMSSVSHVNNYGSKIASYILANGILKIINGIKSLDRVNKGSYALIPNLDLFDLHFKIFFDVELKLLKSNNRELKRILIKMKINEREIAEYFRKFRQKGNKGLHFDYTEEVFSFAGLGLFLQAGGNSGLAKVYLDHMIKKFPEHPYSNFIYGLYLVLLNKPETGRIYIKKSIREAPYFQNPKKFLNILSTNKGSNVVETYRNLLSVPRQLIN